MVKTKVIIVDGVAIRVLPGTVKLIRRICRLADAGGTIQAGDMPKISSDPREHTAASMSAVLRSFGAEVID